MKDRGVSFERMLAPKALLPFISSWVKLFLFKATATLRGSDVT